MLGGGGSKTKAIETTRGFSPPLIRMMTGRSASVNDGLTSGKGDNSPVKSHCSPILLGQGGSTPRISHQPYW